MGLMRVPGCGNIRDVPSDKRFLPAEMQMHVRGEGGATRLSDPLPAFQRRKCSRGIEWVSRCMTCARRVVLLEWRYKYACRVGDSGRWGVVERV